MVFVSPTFQNPTGTTMTLKRRRQLLAICSAHRIPIMEDDAYGGLGLEDSPTPPPLAALREAKGQVIYGGTLSKTFAPGLRIVWIAGPASVVDRLAGVKEQMDLGVSPINQVEHLLTSGMLEQQDVVM